MDLHHISGTWKVVRETGVVPPGLRVTLREKGGWAKLGAVPFGRFKLAGSTLKHRRLPLREQPEFHEDGKWFGRMMWGRRELGRFHLERVE